MFSTSWPLLDVVRFLVDRGANINAKDKLGKLVYISYVLESWIFISLLKKIILFFILNGKSLNNQSFSNASPVIMASSALKVLFTHSLGK